MLKIFFHATFLMYLEPCMPIGGITQNDAEFFQMCFSFLIESNAFLFNDICKIRPLFGSERFLFIIILFGLRVQLLFSPEIQSDHHDLVYTEFIYKWSKYQAIISIDSLVIIIIIVAGIGHCIVCMAAVLFRSLQILIAQPAQHSTTRREWENNVSDVHQ